MNQELKDAIDRVRLSIDRTAESEGLSDEERDFADDLMLICTAAANSTPMPPAMFTPGIPKHGYKC
jgi:hypothetical protein